MIGLPHTYWQLVRHFKMKLQEVKFKHPVKLLQVYRSINEYQKSKKSFDTRKESVAWHNVYSQNGYIHNQELYLPDSITSHPAFNNCGLITIEDECTTSTTAANILSIPSLPSRRLKPANNHCFHLSHPNKLHVFELNYHDALELHLRYDYFEVGIPERDNFKLCTLSPHLPVEVKLNGKLDFSLTSRRQRVFKEQHYIFEYHGDFDSCYLFTTPYTSVLKKIPDERKVIDLIKPLW